VSTPATTSTAKGSPFSGFLIARAFPALVAAAVITFSANHSVVVGQLVFMAYGFVIAPIFVWASFANGFERSGRISFLSMGVVAILGAALTAITIDQGLVAFTLTVGIWAALSGLIELYAGWTSPRRDQAREMFLLGGLTAVFGLVEAVIPLSELYAVGLFGAYAAVLGVFSAIAGFSTPQGAKRPARKKAY
jgi:uncharacterized membrane protein HdeD (DUF308 family)